MKIEASGFWRGVVSIFATNIFATTISDADVSARAISETDKGDGLNLRPND
jgi:hypothetical protein